MTSSRRRGSQHTSAIFKKKTDPNPNSRIFPPVPPRHHQGNGHANGEDYKEEGEEEVFETPRSQPQDGRRHRCPPLLHRHRDSANGGLGICGAWKKVSPNVDPSKTPMSFMKRGPLNPTSIPTKLTINFFSLPVRDLLQGESTKEYEGDDDDDMDGLQSEAEDEGDESDKVMGDDDERDEAASLRLKKLAE